MMKKEDFRVGDRVIALDTCRYSHRCGKTGVIVHIGRGNECIGVEFDDGYTYLHNLSGRLKRDTNGYYHGFWIAPAELDLDRVCVFDESEMPLSFLITG